MTRKHQQPDDVVRYPDVVAIGGAQHWLSPASFTVHRDREVRGLYHVAGELRGSSETVEDSGDDGVVYATLSGAMACTFDCDTGICGAFDMMREDQGFAVADALYGGLDSLVLRPEVSRLFEEDEPSLVMLVDDLVVKPEYRGAKLGVRLVNELIDWAADTLNTSTVVACIPGPDDSASGWTRHALQRYCERLGFTPARLGSRVWVRHLGLVWPPASAPA